MNKKKIIKFTCPKMVIRWAIYILTNILLLSIMILCLNDFYSMIVSVIAIVGTFFIPVKLSGYGFSVFRCFILVKIDSQGISNAFCKMKWNEILDIQYEKLETEFKAKSNKMRIAGNFGLIMLLSKETKENVTFRKYSLKNTICVPFDEEIFTFMEKTEGGGVSP